MSAIFATAGTGVIEGGWEFIWAAYGATWIFFVGYTATLFARSTEPPAEGSAGEDR